MIAPRPIILREILFPTDFSPHSNRALEAALALAEHFGARVHLLHVVDDPSEQKAGLARLKALVPAELEGTEVVRSVGVGRPSAEIVRYAGEHGIDLIVMGTHGRTGLAHLLMGSVTEAVVRTAPCQLLTIGLRPGAERGVTHAAALSAAASSRRHCLVCAQPAQELICDPCKARIQGEAIERKRQDEKGGHRGLPV